MLLEIRVRNFAVIDAVTVSLQPGLNVLTGETGAGKSMLLDAILLIRGARAQTDVIRTDTETATVEAVFEVAPRGPVAAALDEAGLSLDQGQLVIRRELARSGRHRAFVNDSPVTVGMLERLGDHLVEIHGQHEHQRLLEPARQLDLLDRFADAEELRDRVGDLFAKHRAAKAELERVRTAERDRAQREDLLRLQLAELDGARLRVGEEEELRAERRRPVDSKRWTNGSMSSRASSGSTETRKRRCSRSARTRPSSWSAWAVTSRSWPSRSGCWASCTRSSPRRRSRSRTVGATWRTASPERRRASYGSSEWSGPASRSPSSGRLSTRSGRGGSTGSSSVSRPTRAKTS